MKKTNMAKKLLTIFIRYNERMVLVLIRAQAHSAAKTSPELLFHLILTFRFFFFIILLLCSICISYLCFNFSPFFWLYMCACHFFAVFFFFLSETLAKYPSYLNVVDIPINLRNKNVFLCAHFPLHRYTMSCIALSLHNTYFFPFMYLFEFKLTLK